MRLAYIIIVSISILLSILEVIKLGKSKEKFVRWIFYMIFASTLVEIGNLFIALSTSETMALVFFDMYFISLDWVIFSLVGFTFEYTGKQTRVKKFHLYTVFVIMLTDSLILFGNLFGKHYAYDVQITEWQQEAYYITKGYLNYNIHLAIDYVAIVLIILVLLKYIITSVSYYKLKYAVTLAVLGIIVVLNAAYIVFKLPLDWSIMLYALAAIAIDFFSQTFSPAKLLSNALRDMVDSLGEGLILFDVEDNCIYANEFAERLFGINKENCTLETEVIKKWLKGKHPKKLLGMDEQFDLNEGDNYVRYRVVLKHITTVRGKHLGFYFQIEDVTRDYISFIELAKAKEEAEENRKLADEASKAKSAFLANMSHEIRTPINAVLGMNEMILREEGREDILEYAKNIQTSGEALLALINDILDFSKIESGKMELQDVEYKPYKIIRSCENMIQPRVDAKKLVLNVECDEIIPRLLKGDEVRIRQIVTNLLTNAAKYTEKGSITIKAGFEKLSEAKGNLVISVKDTGIGISEENKGKLFNAFQRVDEKRNRNIEGTGLGLSITSQLIRLMGGEITVDSVYGEGSTFKAVIPQFIIDDSPSGVYEKRERAEKKEYKELFRAPDAKILVVDDYKMNLAVIKGLLKKTEVQLVMAKSGQEALDECTKQEFNLILMDHMMPGMDGVETLNRLKSMDTKNINTPVIMLTANAITGVEEEYLKAGFMGYLSKPVDSTKLEKTLLKYIPNELIV